MLDELTIEANEESFVIVLQQWGNMQTIYCFIPPFPLQNVIEFIPQNI